MSRMRIWMLVAALAVALLGCTTQSWYAGTQASAEQECRRKPGDEMQRCLERLKKQDYRDYEKERMGSKPVQQ